MATRAVLADLDDSARKRLLAATDILAERLHLPSVEREARISRSPEPTPRSVGDLEGVACVAEAVVFLVEDLEGLSQEVEQLRQEIADLK